MGYIRDLERTLRDKLQELPDEQTDAVVQFVKDKVYESYKNGSNSSSSDDPSRS